VATAKATETIQLNLMASDAITTTSCVKSEFLGDANFSRASLLPPGAFSARRHPAKKFREFP
jgi:hypothetical protein